MNAIFPEREVYTNQHSRGSIRKTFESRTIVPLDEFTAVNQRNLFSRRKYTPFTLKAKGDVWRRGPGWPDRWYLESVEDCGEQRGRSLSCVYESLWSRYLRYRREKNMVPRASKRNMTKKSVRISLRGD